jgi:hypothetical protein
MRSGICLLPGCNKAIDDSRRSDALYCSDACRQKAHRSRAASEPAVGTKGKSRIRGRGTNRESRLAGVATAVIGELIERSDFKPRSISAMKEVLREVDALGRKSSGDDLDHQPVDDPDVDVTPNWTECQRWGGAVIQELLNQGSL